MKSLKSIPPSLKIGYLLLVAVAIGLAGGALAVAFRYILLAITSVTWPETQDLAVRVDQLAPWVVVAIPALGGLLIGPIISFWAPETRGAGVPEVIHALVAREGHIHHRTTFFKLLCTSISIGCGASVGREGPMVHMGASLGSSVSQLLRLSPEWRRVFLASGAAAGIAATFNAPMAGMLFAAEIILIDFQVSYLSHIAVASVTGTVVSHHFLGHLPRLAQPHFALVSYWEIPLYFLMGLAIGLVAVLFIRSHMWFERFWQKAPVPTWLQPACGGVLVGLLALLVPEVLGVGYGAVNKVMAQHIGIGFLLLLLLGKLLATSCSIGSGFSGGIFAPSLVMGAVSGALFGSIAHTLWPAVTASSSAYALVGMGAMVSGATLAPITALFTIFELTYNFALILPLMTGCIASLLVVQLLCGYSIYEMRLLQKGLQLHRGHDLNLLRSMSVAQVMDRQVVSVPPTETLKQLQQRMETSPYPHYPVIDDNGHLLGMISLRDMQPVLAHGHEIEDLVVAAELMTQDVLTLTPSQNLEEAFHLFEDYQVSALPVVAHGNPRRMVGLLKRSSVLQAYHDKVLHSQMLSQPHAPTPGSSSSS